MKLDPNQKRIKVRLKKNFCAADLMLGLEELLNSFFYFEIKKNMCLYYLKHSQDKTNWNNILTKMVNFTPHQTEYWIQTVVN